MADMGPPNPTPPADLMLEMIKKHQAEPAPEYEQKPSMIKMLLPLLLSQGVDMLTTENSLSQPSPPGWSPPRERNPLPGMQSTVGRLGWQALESALVAALMAKHPKFGRIARDAATVVHSAAATGNQQGVEENQMGMRTYAARGF